MLGTAELLLGRPEAADQPLREALELATWNGDPTLLAELFHAHAALAAVRGQHRKALVLEAGHQAALARLKVASTDTSELLTVQILGGLSQRYDSVLVARLRALGQELGSGDLAAVAMRAGDLDHHLDASVGRLPPSPVQGGDV